MLSKSHPQLKGLGCRVEGCEGEDRVGGRLPARRGSRACQLSLAALRHNENVTAWRPAGCARPSCSPPASPGRGRPPARRLRPGRQRLACPLADRAGRRRCAAAGPAAPRHGCPTPSSPRSSRPCWKAPPPRVRRGAVDPGPHRHGDRAPHWASSIIRRMCGRCCTTGWAGRSSGPSVGPPSATRRRSTAGSRSAGRRSSKRPTAQSLPGLLRRVRAQPDPERAPELGAQGQPPTLTHPFNWKKASMAAALCYGVRGGGAQLAFHVTAGNYDTDTLIEVLSELRRFLGGEKATLLWDGLPAHRSKRDAGLDPHPAVLAGGRAAARLRAAAQPGRGPVVQPQGRRAGQPHRPDPGRGDRPGPAGASSGSAAPRTWPTRSCAMPAYRSHDPSTG